MSLLHTVGQSFRWRPDLECRISDLARWIEGPGASVVILANGYECGFSTCWPEGSRLFLDQFEAAWLSPDGSSNEAAFRACSRFAAIAPTLYPTSEVDREYFDMGPQAATFLAVAVDDATGTCSWVGGDRALVVNAFGAKQDTTPHTLAEAPKYKGIPLDKVPDVLTRVVSPEQEVDVATTSLQFRPGDVLLLVNSCVDRLLSRDDLAYLGSVFASPEVIADEISRIAFDKGDEVYTAVCAVRFEQNKLETAISTLVHEYQPQPRHVEWLGEYSKKHRVLPVTFDSGGVVGLRADGAVVTFGWETPERAPVVDTSPLVNLTARSLAAQHFPQLAAICPQRPETALDCDKCQQWRAAASETDGKTGCPFCCYLGWCPPTASENLARWTDEGKRDPALKSSWWQFWK